MISIKPKILIVDHDATNMELILIEHRLSENKRIEELNDNAQKCCSLIDSPMDATLQTVKDNQILTASTAAITTHQMTQEEICNLGRLNVVDIPDSRVDPLIKELNPNDKATEEQTFKSKVGILKESNLIYERANPQYLKVSTNKELAFQNDLKEKRAAELIIANKELAFQNDEKEKRAAELIIANKELAFQNNLKEKRAAELIIANKELAFQNDEKEKRAAELIIANKELAFQNDLKEKRAAELIIANKELAFQNDEKENRAAELIIANKELAFQNDEKEKRAAELIETNTELTKTNKELDRFVYSVSHDLRSPLTSILGLISFIEEESLETDTLEHAGMIRNSVNRLDEFIKNILSYSRNNRTDLNIVQIPLQKTVSEIVNSLRSVKEAEGIHFEIDIKEQQPFYSDLLRLDTILENLVSNAIKYQKTNHSNGFVKIIGQSNHKKLVLSIIDNGIGIKTKHHEKIFDMFFRIAGKNNGSGIGLYIVKDTIQILQGSIEVHSEEGKGAVFNITLKNLKP